MKTLILVLFSFSLCAQNHSSWQVEQDTLDWYYEIGKLDTIAVTMLISVEDIIHVINGYEVREISGYWKTYGSDGVTDYPQYKHREYLNSVKERLDMEEIKSCGLNFIIWQVKPIE